MVSSLRFALCYDGGSIGQEPDTSGILQAPQNDEKFQSACDPVVRQFQKITADELGTRVEVEYFFLSTKDSINKAPEDWVTNAMVTQQKQDEGFDGVGFVMGTDTSAVAVGALALQAHENVSLRIPIVISAAQGPIYRFDRDGTFNLAQLLKTLVIASREEIADVMYNFSYEIYKGVRLQKKSPFRFDGFESPNFPIVGRIHSDKYGVELDTRYLRTITTTTEPGRVDLVTGFDSTGVHMIDLQPGYRARELEGIIEKLDPKVVILRTNGDHNIASEHELYNLIPVIERATRLGIPILLTAKYPTKSPVLSGPKANDGNEHAKYGPGQEALNVGAIACGDTTDVMVWVKTLRGRAKGITDWKQYMKTNIADEVNANGT